MSDDIVTRLRNSEWNENPHTNVGLCAEAADEIEHLRAAIRHLYFNEGVCYGDNCDLCELVFGLCDDEGVRGE